MTDGGRDEPHVDDQVPVTVRPRRRVRAWGAVAIVVVVALAALAWKDRSDLSAEVDRLQTKLDETRGDASEQINDLEDRVDELEAELDARTSDLEGAAGELSAERSTVAELDAQLGERADELAAASARIEELEADRARFGDAAAPMPDLLGTTLDDATAFADEVGADLVVQRVDPPNVIARPGTIIAQRPAEDVMIVPGAPVIIELFEPAETTPD